MTADRFHRVLARRGRMRTVGCSTKLIASLVALVSAAACATSEGSEHGFSVANRGSVAISDVQVLYGGEIIEFCNPWCKGGRSDGFYGVYMPVQKEMDVSWKTADGEHHTVHIPIKSKLKDERRLSTFYIYIKGSDIEVVQALKNKNKGLLEFEEFPLYP